MLKIIILASCSNKINTTLSNSNFKVAKQQKGTSIRNLKPFSVHQDLFPELIIVTYI
jgi:hypothetical protein